MTKFTLADAETGPGGECFGLSQGQLLAGDRYGRGLQGAADP